MEYRRVAVLAVVGLALATSPLWLFPDEGKSQYTYDRSAVTVEGGELIYEGKSSQYDQFNGLAAVDCQRSDSGGRNCAFDVYLASAGPVNVSKDQVRGTGGTGESFVELRDNYYQRVRESASEERFTYDVEQIPPERLLEEIRQPVGRSGGNTFLGQEVARNGERTTLESPSSVRGVGEVYRVDGTDYVVVVTDRGEVDDVPVPVPHGALSALGAVWLVGLALVVGKDQLDRYR